MTSSERRPTPEDFARLRAWLQASKLVALWLSAADRNAERPQK